MKTRWYFETEQTAWKYAWLIAETRNWTITDYGADAKGYYIEYEPK